MAAWIAALAALAVPASALADSRMPKAAYADVQLPDSDQENAARALMETIRCLVCQGQSVADSDSELAGDMRSLIRTRIAQGESSDSIRTWLVSRYGNWVTYKPPLSPLTAPIWLAPVGLLLIGLVLVRGRLRRRRV